MIFVVVLLALLTGAALRLSYLQDIEYKADEQTMFRVTQDAGRTEPWPALGMVSGAALRNPPLSLWAPTALARATGATDPVALAQRIACLNILALALVFALALRAVPAAERESWLWAGALAAVSPIAVLFSRKIWAQSLLPFFCALFLWAWFRRQTRVGALCWGLLGALVGQIHMSGFFYAAGVAGWTFARERTRGARWSYWLAGSALGTVPLLPWIGYVLSPRPPGNGFSFVELIRLRFWAHWFDDALGLQLNYSLGSAEHWQWMRYPLLGDTATYGVAVCSIFLVIAGTRALYFGVCALGDWLKSRDPSRSGLIIAGVFAGMGILLSLTGLSIHRHYLIIAFPLPWVWLALLLQRGRNARRWLGLVVAAQFFLTVSFLIYIHQNGGAKTGDYGTVYRLQSQ
jgi:4-amino-4-deoxy-L-arabinose transferase-like glycosyltransferase